MRACSGRSTPASGSSRRSKRGDASNARASAIRFCSPPERLRRRAGAATRSPGRDHLPLVRGVVVLDSEADVALHGEMREERVLLRHVADAAVARRHVRAWRVEHDVVERDRARRQSPQAGDGVEQRRLPRARRAEQCERDAPDRVRNPQARICLAKREGEVEGGHVISGVRLPSPVASRRHWLIASGRSLLSLPAPAGSSRFEISTAPKPIATEMATRIAAAASCPVSAKV